MAAVVTASLLAFSAGPAFAGGCAGNSTTAPDARARVNGGSWLRSGTWPSENFAFVLPPGQTVTVEAQWHNVANATKTIRVRGFNFTKGDGMRIKLFVDGENVTSRFRNENPGLTFTNLADGKRTAKIAMQLRNTSASNTPIGQQGLFGYYKGVPSNVQCDSVVVLVNDQT